MSKQNRLLNFSTEGNVEKKETIDLNNSLSPFGRIDNLYQFSLLKNLSIMGSVRSNLFVARYDAITDISSVRSDLFAYQSYTGRSYGANHILTINCYKQYALNRA